MPSGSNLGGYLFAPGPDIPAIAQPLIGWLPEVRVDTLSLVRPLPWALAAPGLRFTPEKWGATVFRLDAPGGAHLLVRRHGSPELALWLPADLAPVAGAPFGLYLHPDRSFSDRVRAASMLARGVGRGPPLRRVRHPQAHRQAAMLCIYDLTSRGAGLREIADLLLDPVPDGWRTSSARSDLRRLAQSAARMIAGEYRVLLGLRRSTDANRLGRE